MSFARYAAYKNSHAPWLGPVPSHWSVKRLGALVRERREKVSDSDYPPLSVTKGGVVPQLDTAAKSDDADNRKRVCRGDFVINGRSDRKGSSGISRFDGSVSLINIVLRLDESLSPAYVHHLLRIESFQEEFYRNGKGIVADLWSTGFGELRNILVAFPPRSEQETIAAFVDCEARKIDALIAAQERLVALLKEKRQAVVSHAVTKGLNSGTRMKSSGFEWLGEVPVHWDVKRLKHVSPQITVGIVVEPSKYYVDAGVPALRSLNVKADSISAEEMVFISPSANEALAKSKLSEGDLVAVRSGQPGTTAVVSASLSGSNCIDLIIIRRSNSASSDYLSRYLNSDPARHQFALGSGGAIQQHFNVETAAGLIVPLPPLAEQEAIVEYLNDRLKRMDQLIAQSAMNTLLLKERRTALISAAVTGQIDVRQLAVAETA